MADRTVSVKLKADISEYTAGLVKAAAQTRGLASDVQKSVDRDLPPVLRDSGEKSGGLLAQGIRSGFIRNSPLIAAAVGAGLAAGAPVALAGAGVLFGGIGAIAAAQSTQVRGAWSQLGRDIRNDAIQDSAVLVPVYVEMADKIGAAFQRMRPEIRDAFEAAAPQIERFTDGLTGAAENALPGLVRAVEQGGPVIDGLATLMEDIGTGLTGFLDAMSDNSGAAGQALESIGDALKEALPLLGELLGEGAELAADVLPAFADALGLVNDIVHALGPALPGLAMGFLAFKTASTAAGFLNSFALSAQRAGIASSGLGSTLQGASRAMPLLAVATAGLATAFNEGDKGAARLEAAVMSATLRMKEGGAEGAKARNELEVLRQVAEHAGGDFLGMGADMQGAFERGQAAAEAFSPSASGGLDTVATAARAAVTALVDVPGVATSATGAIAFLGDTARMSEDQVDAAASAVVAWRTEVATIASAFVEPLSVYQGLLMAKSESEREAAKATAESTVSSSDSWVDYVETTKVTLNELAAKLQEQLTNQENWRSNIVAITQRGGTEVGQAFLDMGVEGAALSAQMANATDAEFRRMADLMIADTRFGGQQAAAELDAAMRVMAAVGSAGAGATAAGIARQLGIGVTQVQQIAAQYGVSLASGINPILAAVGKAQVALSTAKVAGFFAGFAGGGYTGDGGKFEPKGVVHGGEYVVTKERTARLGVDRLENLERILPNYARGGFVSPAAVPRPPGAPFGHPIGSAGDGTMQRGYDAVSAFVAAQMEPQGGSGGSASGLLPIMAAARQYVMDTYGIRNIGGYANRNIAGTNVKSDHAMGKAIDIMTSNGPLGWAIANDFAFGAARKQFKAENVIWQQSISSNGGRFVGMADRGSPTQNHRDHVHVDTYKTGTPYVPHDGMAYLHRGEAVVPAEINTRSREFSGGGGGGAGGVGVSVNLVGAQISGTVAFDPSGMLRFVDARVEAAEAAVASGLSARGVHA